jgi:hypothetical protein
LKPLGQEGLAAIIFREILPLVQVIDFLIGVERKDPSPIFILIVGEE